jgi:hypothetical protein
MLDFVLKMFAPSETTVSPKKMPKPAMAHEDGITTSMIVSVKTDRGISVVTVYDNSDVMSDYKCKVIIDADSQNFNEQLGTVISSAITQIENEKFIQSNDTKSRGSGRNSRLDNKKH